MDKHTGYKEGIFQVDGCPVSALADEFGTPLYVYSENILRQGIASFQDAFRGLDPLVRYSCKANANIHLLSVLREAGSGADVISAGELSLALRAGFPPGEIIMEGPGKSPDEIKEALGRGVSLFSVESVAELSFLREAARRSGRKARALLRLNPDIPAGGHHYINTGRKENKFGMTREEVHEVFASVPDDELFETAGLHMHLGSQIDGPAPFLEAIARARKLHGKRPFRILDLGGGFPVRYREAVPGISVFGTAIEKAMAGFDVRLMLEPGRSIVAPCGFLLTRVLYRKDRPHKKFLVVDAAMNDLLRPSLYDAWHDIYPGREPAAPASDFDVVGPICETGDFLARKRPLPGDSGGGDLFLVAAAGAYGYVMASNYNGRPRPAEVMVTCGRARLVRRRETIDDLCALMNT